MEKAIKKAIEGGWCGYSKNVREGQITLDEAMKAMLREMPFEKMLLDPLFWQALGKAEGWDEAEHYRSWQGSRGRNELWTTESVFYWHRFIDHLAEGKDVESFFNELLK